MSGQTPPGGGSGTGSGRDDDDPFAVRPATDADRERPSRPLAPIGWGRSEDPVPAPEEPVGAPAPAPEDDILAGIVPLDPADDEERVAPLDQADLDADDRDPHDLPEPAPEPDIADAPVDAGEVGFPGEPDPGYVPAPSGDADPDEVLTGEVLSGDEPASSDEAPAELVLEPVEEGDRAPLDDDGTPDEQPLDEGTGVDAEIVDAQIVDAEIVEDASSAADPVDVADADDTVLLTPLAGSVDDDEDDEVVDDPAVADDDRADGDAGVPAPAPAPLAPAATAARAAAMAWAAGSATEAPASPAAAPPATAPPAYVPPASSPAMPPSRPGPEERRASAVDPEDPAAAWSVAEEAPEQGPPTAPGPEHADPRIDDGPAPLPRDAPEGEPVDAAPAVGTDGDRVDSADDEPVDAIALLFGDVVDPVEPDEPVDPDESGDPEEERTRVLPAGGAGAAAAAPSSPRADGDAPTVATPLTPARASSPGGPDAGRVPPPYAPPSAPAPYAKAARTPTPPPEAPASPPRPPAPRDPRGPRRTAFWVGGALLLVLLLIGLFSLGQRLGSGATSEAEPTPSATAEATPTPSPTPADPVQGPAGAGVQAWDALLGGECIDPYTTPWEEEFTVVACAVEHPAQMVARVALPQTDDAYPGVDAVRESADELCIADTVIDYAAARAYDDVQYQSAYPITEEEWAAGDRDAYCFVSRAGGGAFTSSIGVPQPPVIP